jgi:hypothetical protein
MDHTWARLPIVVPGHRSELAFGKVRDVPVVAMLGRVRLFSLLPFISML